LTSTQSEDTRRREFGDAELRRPWIYDERCQTGRDAPPEEDGRCFHPHTSVIWDIVSREIRVSTDGGRLIRPFYKLGEDGSVPEVKEGAQWHELITDGTMEYLDVEEAAFTSSLRPEEHRTGKDRLYGDPSELVLGVLASCIPFPDHNQSPRNSYQSAMENRPSDFTRFFRHRMDTGIHVMDYGQRPIASSKVADMMGCSEMPSGINVIVAISTLGLQSGRRSYPQQDFRRARSVHEHITIPYVRLYRRTPSPERSSSTSRPTNRSWTSRSTTARSPPLAFRKPVPLSKPTTSSLRTCQTGEEERDASYALKTNEHGVIDKIIANGKEIVRSMAIRSANYDFVNIGRPIGDKFSSRSDKGTVGMLVAAHDMPYTASGLVPDIMNPHALPSRMTVGMLLESILSKACCYRPNWQCYPIRWD
jgi:DNA-directed RNA polymerase beta subunit